MGHTAYQSGASARGKSAWTAMLASGVFASAALAFADPPAAWLSADAAPPLWPANAIASPWQVLCAPLPTGELIRRLDLLALLLVLATGVAATWLAHQVFRGPGRWAAAVVAGPVSVLAVAHWLRTQEASSALAELVFSLLAITAVGTLVRSVVHLGRLTPVATTRVLAAASAGAVVSPRAGLPLLALVAAICGARTTRTLRARAMGGGFRVWGRALARELTPAFAIAIAIGVSCSLAVYGVATPPIEVPRGLTVRTPDIAKLGADLGTYLVYPGLALILLLVLPLRWRGGAELAALTLGALLVGDSDGTLAPAPIVLVSLAASASGWVWLAGSAVANGRMARGLALGAAAIVGALGTQPSWSVIDLAHGPTPLANGGQTPSYVRLHDRGLLAPGDVAIVFEPGLREQLRWRRDHEGARPDAIVVDPQSVEDARLAEAAGSWSSESRRVLSDSFTLGGRWPARWATDSGPWFWFVGEHELDDGSLTNLDAYMLVPSTELPHDVTIRWERFHVERARYRRATGRAAGALEALPIEPELRESMVRAFRVAGVGRPVAQVSPELLGRDHYAGAASGAISLTEAGDLLYGAGLDDMATRLLAEAARLGSRDAIALAAHWQIRSGHEGTTQTLDALTGDPELRPEAVSVLDWSVARGRLVEALEIRRRLVPMPGAAAEEIGARLALLRALSPSQ